MNRSPPPDFKRGTMSADEYRKHREEQRRQNPARYRIYKKPEQVPLLEQLGIKNNAD